MSTLQLEIAALMVAGFVAGVGLGWIIIGARKGS
jgi:hypothetical protein